jgi:hypothetical protein
MSMLIRPCELILEDAGEKDPHLRGWWYLITGWMIPSAPSWSVLPVLKGEDGHSILVQRLRIWKPPSALYGEITWTATGEESISIGEVDLRPHTAYDLGAIHRTLKRIRWQLKRGRPPGSGYFSTREEFIAILRLVMTHVQRHNPPVSKTKVAKSFAVMPRGIRTSQRQLQAWLQAYEVDWSELRRTIES